MAEVASARGDQTQTEKGGQTEQQILQGCQGELLPGIWYTCMCVCVHNVKREMQNAIILLHLFQQPILALKIPQLI